MNIILDLQQNTIMPAIVMLSSLCINNKVHFDAYCTGSCSNKDIADLGNKLSQYDISFYRYEDKDLKGIIYPIDVIIDGNIQELLTDMEISNDGRNLYDFALNAPSAHDNGHTYADVRGKYKIIAYPEDKPWLCTNIHYDIEKIWWEYAGKTEVYMELMEGFLESALSETFLEEYAIKVNDENKELTEAIQKAVATAQNLFGEENV